MKQLFILAITLFYISGISYSQQHPNVGCVDKAIKMQAGDLQLTFAKQGMTVYRDAMISMNSQEPFPIAVQLNKGKLYQLIFIGSKSAGKIKMELFDGEDTKIAEKDASLSSTDKNSNCIIYSFVPGKTDLYLIVLSQKMKNRTICGSFTIMEKGGDKKEGNGDTITHARPQQPPVNKNTQKQPPKSNPRYVPTNK